MVLGSRPQPTGGPDARGANPPGPGTRADRGADTGVGGVVNVADLVRRNAAEAPERIALVSGSRRLTWSELDQAVEETALGMAAAGLVTGYRVGIALPNSADFVIAYLGALRGGFVAVPMNPLAPAPELARVLEHTRPRLVLAGAETVDAVRSAVPEVSEGAGPRGELLVSPVGVPARPGERPYSDLRSAAPADVPVVTPADPEALAVLIHTSGTSAEPRAVMLTHRALLANLDQLAALEPPPLEPSDVVLGLVPFFHVFGLGCVLGAALRAGACLVPAARFDAEETLALIRDEQITVVPVAPPVLTAWAAREDLATALSGVRLLLSGAAPLPVAVAERVADATGRPVHEGYGLSEAAPVVTSTLCSPSRVPGSVGRALPGVEIRIGGAGDERLGPDDPGEVCVRGPNLFSGYWPDGRDGPDDDGWFGTGDLGYLDENGELFLVDRSRELVLVSGFNVYPHEVEETIAELDAVSEVAVVGAPEPTTGETVHAYVVPGPVAPEDDRERAASALRERVLQHCRRRLARFKCPTVVEIVDELPKSVTGKVSKVRLRQEPTGEEAAG